MRQDKAIHASRTAVTSSTQGETPTPTSTTATAQVSAAMSQQQQRVHKAATQPKAASAAATASAGSASATEGETETENTPYAEHRVDMRCPNSILHAAQQQQMPAIDMALSASAALEGRSGSAATHKSHGQQTVMPKAVHTVTAAELLTTAAATKSTIDCKTVNVRRLPAVDKDNDNKSNSSTLLTQQQQQQQLQQQQRTVATTKSTPAVAEKADSAFHTSNIFTAVCRGYSWASAKDRTNSKALFQLLNMIFFMLCLIACALAMYSIVRHSRNEQRLRQVLQLDERISALELRLQLCEQRQQPRQQHFDLDTNRPLNNERASPELDTGDLHNQLGEPSKQMSVDVTQTLQRLSRQVSDLHRLRRDVSHLQISRRQQQRRQASLAAATTVDGLLLQTPQQTHSGECGCTAGE